MRIAKISIALLLAIPSASLASSAFGVVSTDGTTACVATTHRIESFPLQVQIVIPDRTQRIVVGTITSALKAPCQALANAGLAGAFYAIRSGDELAPRELGIARFNVLPNVQFRSCTSTEGVHLTAWTGEPLSSKRLWHEYVYLGYDVEPTCSDQDFHE